MCYYSGLMPLNHGLLLSQLQCIFLTANSCLRPCSTVSLRLVEHTERKRASMSSVMSA